MNDTIKTLARRLANAGTLGYFNRYRALQHEFQSTRSRYLDLMEGCLTGVIYEDAPLTVLGQEKFDAQLREYGWDWPSKAHTMIGLKRLANVRFLSEDVIRNHIAGDFMETGVWRGGACIMMRAVIAAYAAEDRRVWLADSFEGLPPPSPDLYPADADEKFHEYKELSISMDTVRDNFRKYNLLDEKLSFLKGWFKDTLPNAPVKQLALLRLDGDLYESTIIPLEALYDKVTSGGYVIVDDYHVVKGCREAVHDFWSKRSISPDVVEIDGVGIYWRKA
jgi:O-methyltransferase